MYAPRRIRSFVLRAGRVTVAQERALAELWPLFGIDFVGLPLDLDAAFRRSAADRVPPLGAQHSSLDAQHSPLEPERPLSDTGHRARRCLEIGFGAGEVLGALAAANPHIDYLGIEVHRSGVGRLLLQLERARLANVRIICHDAVEVLRTGVPADSFDEVLVFFPDPWHKKRHHKRRLVDCEFVALLADKMAPGGILRLATDWHDYALQMLRVCNANERLSSLSADGGFAPRPDLRQPTRFERRGARLGHGVWDLAYVKRTVERADRSTQEAATNTIDDELHREGSQHHAG
jgi:tRNA (guanine-N7-)-methyltransferase